jgi:hypothetical protein
VKARNLLCAGLCLASVSFISVFSSERFNVNLNFSLGFPQNEFKDNVDNIGLGGFGQFTYRLPETPVHIGASIGFLIYGSDSRKEYFSPDIKEVTVDVTTTNSILLGHLLMRIQARSGTLRPYMTGLFGFNYFQTRTSVKSENNWDDDDEIASSTNFEDATLSYGGGAGLLIRVYHPSMSEIQENHGLRGVYIDFSVNSLFGGEAEYLKKGSIHQNEDGNLIYDVYRSKTDLMTWHIGVSLEF